MATNTVRIYFVARMKFCAVDVFKEEAPLIRTLLKANPIVEGLLPKRPREFQVIDVEHFAHLIAGSLRSTFNKVDEIKRCADEALFILKAGQ